MQQEEAVAGAVMTRSGLDRTVAFFIAAASVTGLAIQLLLLLQTFAATGEGALAGVWRFFGYFTILTNILVAFAAIGWLVGRRPSARTMAMIAVSIAVVGFVYVTVLRGLWDPQGWQLLADILLHYVTPVAFIGFWLAFAPRRQLAWRDALFVLVFPATYLAYALARGALDGWYPYFFINLPNIGAVETARNAAGLLGLFALLGLGAVALNRR